MATVFRGRVITAVAVVSTSVAINSQPAGSRLGLIGAATQPRHTADFPAPIPPKRTIFVQYHDPQFTPPNPQPAPFTDWPLPKAASPPPYVQDVRNRHVFLVPPNPQPPFSESEWPSPNAPIRSIVADAILNPNTFVLQPVGQPFRLTDWPPTAITSARPYGVHHRPQNPPVTPPVVIRFDWPNPAARGPQILVEPFRNGLVLPVPVVGVTPFAQSDWPTPKRLAPKPETFLFYYIQDQTRPSFIQFDWPKSPKLPSLVADAILNRLVLPVPVVQAPFSQHDWPNASTRSIAKIVDPYNRNVFLPVPQGQPGYQSDWTLPNAPRALQGSHTVNDIPLLTRIVASPEHRNYDWPLPARCMLLTIMWEPQGTTPIYLPTFQIEWAENSNQIVGPWAPQPETH